MAPNPHKIKGKGFDAHPENINRKGAPKKVINRISEITQRDYGIKLTKSDIYQMIQHCLEMDLKALTKIVQERTDPVFMICIATAIMNDIKKGNITTVESIFDRIFGKPVQGINLDVNPMTVQHRILDEKLASLSVEELERIANPKKPRKRAPAKTRKNCTRA